MTRKLKGKACLGCFLGLSLGSQLGNGQPVREARAVLGRISLNKIVGFLSEKYLQRR